MALNPFGFDIDGPTVCSNCTVNLPKYHRCVKTIIPENKSVRIIEITGVSSKSGYNVLYAGNLYDLESKLSRPRPCACQHCAEESDEEFNEKFDNEQGEHF